MKKLNPILSVLLLLIYWGCEDKPEVVSTSSSEITIWGEVYSVENTDTIYLNVKMLNGPMPPETGKLTNLTRLVLNENQFTRVLPSEIGNLTNLTYLNIRE